MSIIMQDMWRLPGPAAVRDTVESQFIWNKGVFTVFDMGAIIDGTSTDVGNTNKTTTLRGGLLMGKVASTGKLKPYAAANTDGTQIPYGIMPFDVHVVDADGNTQDRTVGVCIGGYVKGSKLFGLDQWARNIMQGAFRFDDNFFLPNQRGVPWLKENNQVAAYTVLAADSGTLFTTGGAATITFTLPTLALATPGCTWWFFNLQNNNMVITAPTGKLIADGNAAGTNATYSTASHIIGSFAQVTLNAAGTFYYLQNLGGTAVTIT